MSLKNSASAFVLAIIFFSLLGIYLVTYQDPLVTGLAIVIMAISLVIAVIGGWRETAALAGFAVLVSLVAVGLFGQARFGDAGGIVLPIMWGSLLVIAFTWASRNVLRVPDDQSVLILNTYTGGRPYAATAPISRPILPLLERKYATIPMYKLGTEVSVKNINTAAGHNIDLIRVGVGYQVVNTTKLIESIPNRGEVEAALAKAVGQDVDDARTNITFWEKLLAQSMQGTVDGLVREVVFDYQEEVEERVQAATGETIPRTVGKTINAVKAYNLRNTLEDRVQEKLRRIVDDWGLRVNGVEFEHFDVNPDRFKSANQAIIDERENKVNRMVAEREALRIREVRKAQAELEAERVKMLVQALREANVDLTPDMLEEVVISAIRVSTDLETDLMRLPELPPPAKSGDKK